MKLQNKARREIELVLLDLKRARDYLMSDSTAVCRAYRKGGHATTTLHMQRKLDGAVFYEVNKEIGSNLTGLDEGILKLERMLAPEIETLDV